MILTACFSFLYLFPLKVILEDLPDEFATALREYNRQVTDVFSQYLTAVAADFEKERGVENKLPLTGIGKKLPYHFIFENFFLPMVVLLWVIGLFWQETKFSIRSMTSSFELQGSVFSWKQLFVFYGFDKNYTWHVLSVFFVCLFFRQATLTSQFYSTAKRKAWCYFGNSISRSKRTILGKLLILGQKGLFPWFA